MHVTSARMLYTNTLWKLQISIWKHIYRMNDSEVNYDNAAARVKTHKLLKVCRQVVTNLFTNCQQVVFALLVPMLLQQVRYKLLKICNKLVDIIRLVARLFQQV